MIRKIRNPFIIRDAGLGFCVPAKRVLDFASLLSVIFIAGTQCARGDLIASEPIGEFGSFSQLNAGVTGSDALRGHSCVPTSVANGLAFLNNHFIIPGLMQSGYGTVNALSTAMGTTEAGTDYPGMTSGTTAYLSNQGVASLVSLAGGETKAFPVTLYDWLLADYAVEFWIAWDGGGAHSVTLTAIDLTEDAGGHFTGSGTLSFLDPYGGTPMAGGNAAGPVVITDASFITDSGGAMHIVGGYTTGAAFNPSDPDNTTASATGMIINDLAEQFVPLPEPSALAMVATGFLCLRRSAIRKRPNPCQKSRARRNAE